jgi:hypothetical protein
MEHGYYRFPTIHNDTVVFVCEGDLWSVPTAGGVARRLTSNPGEITTPVFSAVKTLRAETPARYRAWVEANRAHGHGWPRWRCRMCSAWSAERSTKTHQGTFREA